MLAATYRRRKSVIGGSLLEKPTDIVLPASYRAWSRSINHARFVGLRDIFFERTRRWISSRAVQRLPWNFVSKIS